LEKIAYNALPAAFTPDMWAHQYDQQANQVLCTIDPRQWTNNEDDSNIFWPGTELRLLHRQSASGLAQIRQEFVDGIQ